MNPCRLFALLNMVALVTVSTGYVVGPPIGWPLAAVGLLAWVLAREQLEKC